MLKKLIVTGAAAGLLLVSASAAFAHHSSDNSGVSNNVVNTASSGDIRITGEVRDSNVQTGNALATVDAKNVVKGDCGCKLPVTNNVLNKATSGDISVSGRGGVKNSVVWTGDASAGVTALNVVDTKVVEQHHRDR